MNIDFTQIIISAITLFLGFILRDLYAYIKQKLGKVDKPKISVDYTYKYFSAWSENPRKYKFKSVLCIQNIDTIPIYDVTIYKYIDKDIGNALLKKVSLKPDEKIEQEEDKIIEYGDGYNHPEEAENLLPKIFVNPIILIHYKNKNGKLFKFSWQKK